MKYSFGRWIEAWKNYQYYEYISSTLCFILLQIIAIPIIIYSQIKDQLTAKEEG